MDKIAKIAETGNDLETLRALRLKLATTLDETKSARDIPPLVKRLQEVLREIAELEKIQSIPKNEIDSILERRRGGVG